MPGSIKTTVPIPENKRAPEAGQAAPGDFKAAPVETKETPTKHIVYLEGNERGNDIIVPDVHGSAEALKKLIKEHLESNDVDRVIFVGDLCDKGPASLEVVTLLMDAAEKYKGRIFFAMGNHESELIKKQEELIQGIKAKALYIKTQNNIKNGILNLEIPDHKAHVDWVNQNYLHYYQNAKFFGLEWTLDITEEQLITISEFFKKFPYIFRVKPTSKIPGYFVVHADLPFKSQAEFNQNQPDTLTHEENFVTEHGKPIPQTHHAIWARKVADPGHGGAAFLEKDFLLTDDLVITGHNIFNGLNEQLEPGLNMVDYRLCLDAATYLTGLLPALNITQSTVEIFESDDKKIHDELQQLAAEFSAKTPLLQHELIIFLNMYPALRAIGNAFEWVQKDGIATVFRTYDKDRELISAKLNSLGKLYNAAIQCLKFSAEEGSAREMVEKIYQVFFKHLPTLAAECKVAPELNKRTQELVNEVFKNQIKMANGQVCILHPFVEFVYIVDDKNNFQKYSWDDLCNDDALVLNMVKGISNDPTLIDNLYPLIKNKTHARFANALLLYFKNLTQKQPSLATALAIQLNTILDTLEEFDKSVKSKNNPEMKSIHKKHEHIHKLCVAVRNKIIEKKEDIESTIIMAYSEILNIEFHDEINFNLNKKIQELKQHFLKGFVTRTLQLANGEQYCFTNLNTVGVLINPEENSTSLMQWDNISDNEEGVTEAIQALLCLIQSPTDWEYAKNIFVNSIIEKNAISIKDLLNFSHCHGVKPVTLLSNIMRNHNVPADWKLINLPGDPIETVEDLLKLFHNTSEFITPETLYLNFLQHYQIGSIERKNIVLLGLQQMYFELTRSETSSRSSLLSAEIIKDILLNDFNFKIQDDLSQKKYDLLQLQLNQILNLNLNTDPQNKGPIAFQELVSFALEKRAELVAKLTSKSVTLFGLEKAATQKQLRKLVEVLKSHQVTIPSDNLIQKEEAPTFSLTP